MTIAEIRSKISDTGANLSERMEDLLTSDIFGCLRYIPYEVILIPFLKTSTSCHGNTIAVPNDVTRIHYLFWPYLRTLGCIPCEPDVVLGFETKLGIHLIMIESKYYSGLSSDEDDRPEPNNQLARELDNLNHMFTVQLGLSPMISILSRSLVFVTQDMKIPLGSLTHSLSEYKLKRGKDGDIFWTSWRFIPCILEKRLEVEQNPEHKAVMEDMLQLLKRKWLTMFSGIEAINQQFYISNFDFYHISSRRFHWPNLHIIQPTQYTYKLPHNKYSWPTIPLISNSYEYKS